MAIPILSALDFYKTELLNARLQNLGVDPTGLGAGDKGLLWIDGSGVIKYWDGSSIKELGLSTGGNAETLDGEDGLWYLDRANHTGTQLAATISDLTEATEDAVAAFIVDGSNISTVYDDPLGTLTISVVTTGLDSDTVDGFEGADLEKVANKGVANGYASLDSGGKVPSNQLPPLALTEVHVVLDATARDALVVQEGDVAIVTSESTTYIYDGTAWQEMEAPAGGVTAVTGAAPISSTGGSAPEISLDDLGVSTAKLADGSVTGPKLGDSSVDLAGAKVTGTLPIANGGTGAVTAAAARTALGATGKVSFTIGDGTNTEYTLNHLLGTRDVQVEVYRNSTPWDKVMVDVERPTVDDVLVRFAVAPATDTFRVVVVG